LIAFFALLNCSLAAPISDATQLEKRVTHTGRGTYFEVGLGNCGWTNKDSDHIVAMSKAFYDANDGGNCGQKLSITWGGKTATATMVDSCPGCGYYDLDMSPSLFQVFSGLDRGVLSGLTWHFLSK
ncbi:RlpA-like double-psi beta-barrel-protein domain-containing protein-containing protein, partial [Amylostereum chailletii]